MCTGHLSRVRRTSGEINLVRKFKLHNFVACPYATNGMIMLGQLHYCCFTRQNYRDC